MSDTTRYSEKMPGDEGNYRQAARFDITDSVYLGITQWKDGGRLERVLLSPEQVAALRVFLAPRRSHRGAKV